MEEFVKTLALSVVIPTLGRSPHLRGLLERLQRQVTDFTFEVLVVANIPQQSLRKLVNSMGHGKKEHARFEYLETGRLGVNLARNKGLERARGDIVLFLDDDAILESDSFLAMHVEHHRLHSDATAIGGPYHLTARRTKWDLAYHQIAHDWLLRHSQSRHRTTQLLGGNASFKKSILDQHSWKFDEEISFGGSETGLCLRIALAGKTLLYFPDLTVGHAPQMNWFTFCRKAFLQGAGARWRATELLDLNVRFVNEWRQTKVDDFEVLESAIRLYRRCFEFGWESNAYEPRLASVRRNDPPTFHILSYAIFRLRKMKILRRLRNAHRKFYVSLRTAWLNGSISRPTLKPSETAR